MCSRPDRLSTSLNSKFLFNCISTPLSKEGSFKFEPAMCRAFFIHGLAHRNLWFSFPFSTGSKCFMQFIYRLLAVPVPLWIVERATKENAISDRLIDRAKAMWAASPPVSPRRGSFARSLQFRRAGVDNCDVSNKLWIRFRFNSTRTFSS